MPKAKLLIFDWDGTLIDSVPRIVRCFNESFDALGLERAEEASIKAMIGLPLTESYKYLVPEGSGISLEQFVDAYRVIWRDEARLPLSPLFVGVPELLAKLADAGYRMCVATGKSREGLERELNHYNLYAYFEDTRCANETEPKPHPQMIDQLLVGCGIGPADAWMIGDTPLDLNMGKAAGVRCMGVTSGSQTQAQLQACEPEVIFERITDATGYLLD